MAEYESHEFDVIIVGAGGAGLRAAIEARSRGLRTAPGAAFPLARYASRAGGRQLRFNPQTLT